MTLNFEYDLDAVTVSQHAEYRSLGAKRLVWTTVRVAEKEQWVKILLLCGAQRGNSGNLRSWGGGG